MKIRASELQVGDVLLHDPYTRRNKRPTINLTVSRVVDGEWMRRVYADNRMFAYAYSDELDIYRGS